METCYVVFILIMKKCCRCNIHSFKCHVLYACGYYNLWSSAFVNIEIVIVTRSIQFCIILLGDLTVNKYLLTPGFKLSNALYNIFTKTVVYIYRKCAFTFNSAGKSRPSIKFISEINMFRWEIQPFAFIMFEVNGIAFQNKHASFAYLSLTIYICNICFHTCICTISASDIIFNNTCYTCSTLPWHMQLLLKYQQLSIFR